MFLLSDMLKKELQMKKSKLKNSKSYESFGKFFARKKIEASYSLASLLIEKFAKARKPSEWQCITAEDLKQKGILSSEKNQNFGHWRDVMIKNRFLICMATREELQEKSPNHKGNMFKIGEKIKNYIDLAIQENLPAKVEDINNEIDNLQLKIDSKADESDVLELKEKSLQFEEKIKNLENEMLGVYNLLLKALPPDTEERRNIIKENLHDYDLCLKKLDDEKQQKEKHN